MRWRSFLIKIGLLFILGGCISAPPRYEYSIARAALQAAYESEAPKYSPGYWHRAQSNYRKAEKLYKDNERDDAKKYFTRARKFAERAETSAKLARAQGGGF